jgi:hypothetical protein
MLGNKKTKDDYNYAIIVKAVQDIFNNNKNNII